MSWLKGLKNALQKLAEPMHPRAERRTASGLVASFMLDSASTSAAIKDVSSTGIYLLTDKRPPTGALLTLTLQKDGEPGNSSNDLQFSIPARVERPVEDGIALSFVLPPGLNPELWGVLLQGTVLLTDQKQVALMFHTLQTIFFICRLCQSLAEEAIVLLSGELDSNRIETLIQIAVGAENLLASQPGADRMRAHPTLVANILRQGAWASGDRMRRLWTGLLASSCSTDVPDDSNHAYVDLLMQITPEQANILTHAGERALGSAQPAGNSPTASVVLTTREMVELTGVHNHIRNVNDVAYLFNLGLIEKPPHSTSYQPAESFDITPTKLGLELYKHCRTSRE